MSRRIKLVNREISIPEMKALASFQILWPDSLPEKFSSGRTMELSSSLDRSSNTDVFILEYLDDEGNWIHVWQSSHMEPDYSNKPLFGHIVLDGLEIPVYELDELKSTFWKQKDVHIEILFENASISSVEQLALSIPK